jgi:hypothetical protein
MPTVCDERGVAPECCPLRERDPLELLVGEQVGVGAARGSDLDAGDRLGVFESGVADHPAEPTLGG